MNELLKLQEDWFSKKEPLRFWLDTVRYDWFRLLAWPVKVVDYAPVRAT